MGTSYLPPIVRLERVIGFFSYAGGLGAFAGLDLGVYAGLGNMAGDGAGKKAVDDL